MKGEEYQPKEYFQKMNLSLHQENKKLRSELQGWKDRAKNYEDEIERLKEDFELLRGEKIQLTEIVTRLRSALERVEREMKRRRHIVGPETSCPCDCCVAINACLDVLKGDK